MTAMIRFITDIEIYQEVICQKIPKAEKLLWIATSDLKDLHVDKGNRVVPFLEVLSGLIGKHVEIRLLHAKEPGQAWV